MALVPRGRGDPNVRLLALALASGVPLAAYLATASAYDYWLDAGEFTAQATQLDIAHPPGHPLAGLLGRLIAYLPIGPIGFRVALAQALCVAAAAGFFFAAIHTTVRAMGTHRDRVAIPLSLGATWLVATSVAFWMQAVRPEVYGLQALLMGITIERVVALEARWPTTDVRPLYTAALALGLGLANHHFVAFLVMPALAPTFARVYRARGWRPLAFAAIAGAIGLASYVYLPVRARVDPPINLGDPRTLENLFWVVSAKVYQENKGLDAPLEPLGVRLGEVVLIAVENLHVVALVLALAGLYAMLRTAGARRIGYVWAALAFFVLTGPAWIMSVRNNPDILGYMMSGLAALAALGAAFVGAVLARFEARDAGWRATATSIAFVFGVLGLARVQASADAASLAGFHATNDFDEMRIRRLPPHAIVIAHWPQTVFRHWSVQATEAARPDVTLVPMPFLAYPGVLDALVARDPDVADLLRGYRLEGSLQQPDLQSLAARRPVRIDLGFDVPPSLYETLVPDGLYYEVVDAGATDTDVLEASGPHLAAIRALYARLGSAVEERETRQQLLITHYMDALYYASAGAREPARQCVQMGLALDPEARELRGLAEALADPTAEGPLDVTPFFVAP